MFDDLAQKNISCGTVRLHRKGMPKDLKPKTLRLKHVDIQVRSRGGLIAVVWRDKRGVCLLTNIHNTPTDYRDEHRNAIKPAIVDYNHYMGHVDNADKMANSYTASCRTWKWTKKLFCHLLDLAIVNSYILFSSCGGKKISHTDFQLASIREMFARVGHEPRPSMPVGRSASASENIRRLDVTISTGLAAMTRKPDVTCVQQGAGGEQWYTDVKCDVALRVDRNCFEVYHADQFIRHLFIRLPCNSTTM